MCGPQIQEETLCRLCIYIYIYYIHNFIDTASARNKSAKIWDVSVQEDFGGTIAYGMFDEFGYKEVACPVSHLDPSREKSKMVDIILLRNSCVYRKFVKF